MAVVYRTTDRVTLKIDDVTFKISPLSYKQKMAVQSLLTKQDGSSIENVGKTTKALLSMAVKSVDGVFYPDGEKFVIERDDNGVTDSCMDELLNMEIAQRLTVSVMQMIQGIPTKIVNSETGEALEGVEIVPREGVAVKK